MVFAPGRALGRGAPFAPGKTRATFAGFTFPTNRHIVGLLGLNFVDSIENDHSFGNFGRVLEKLSFARGPTPYRKSSRRHYFCCSSIICFNSAGRGGMFCRTTFISPLGPRRTMILNSLKALSLFG